MLLSNYIRLKEHILNVTSYSIGSGSSMYLIYTPVKDFNGNSCTIMSYSGTTALGMNYSLHKNLIPKLGTGNTPVTAEDYCLSNNVTSSFSNLTAVLSEVVSVDTDGIPNAKIVMSISGVNTSGSSVTIKEVGLSKNMDLLGAHEILFVRHILDTPITVAAGDSFTLPLQWIEY